MAAVGTHSPDRFDCQPGRWSLHQTEDDAHLPLTQFTAEVLQLCINLAPLWLAADILEWFEDRNPVCQGVLLAWLSFHGGRPSTLRLFKRRLTSARTSLASLVASERSKMASSVLSMTLGRTRTGWPKRTIGTGVCWSRSTRLSVHRTYTANVVSASQISVGLRGPSSRIAGNGPTEMLDGPQARMRVCGPSRAMICRMISMSVVVLPVPACGARA